MTDQIAPVLLVMDGAPADWLAACAEALPTPGAAVTTEPRTAAALAAVGRPLWVCGPADAQIQAEPACDWLQRRYPRLAVVAVIAGGEAELAHDVRRLREQGAWRWPRWWPWPDAAPMPLSAVETGSVGVVFAPAGAGATRLMVLSALAQAGPLTAGAYALTVAAEVERLYRAGLRLLAIGSAPNTPAGGWGVHWRSAGAHGAWWLSVERRLRAWFPELRVGYPALACAARGDAALAPDAFLDLNQSALNAADWMLVSAEWATPAGRWALTGGQLVKVYRRRWQTPPLVLMGPHPAAALAEQALGTVGIGALLSAIP